MDDSRSVKLHLELDIEIEDASAVQEHARAWAREQASDDPESLTQMLDQVAEGAESALLLMVDPEDVFGETPGAALLGAAMWVGESEETSDTWPEEGAAEDALEGDFGDGDIAVELGLESEEDWVTKIVADAAKLPGLDLQTLGYDADERDPDARAISLQEATVLRGAMHWAYESFIDELFDDISLLREAPDAIGETLQISSLPPLYQSSYGPLFAQRFLAVALDLGTALASAFQAPSCVAQELALRLVVERVGVLSDVIPSLELPEDWQEILLDSLFEDLDHELLYSPELDGISHDPALASLGMANLDVSAWFTPFVDRTVNPYAANG